ncbi:protein of unknown function [Asanoa hainanensis]|uniref:DUF4253 domain-containing protein n=2 Tax=Asanoa hainanensis TaxID=560556 RepID=A0A239N4J8_9ACTN|nr:protein of unknown function [Asanoa hainanensis]
MWISDAPATPGSWAAARADHHRSGLWPLLLDSLDRDGQRPWESGELGQPETSAPDDYDAETVLAHLFAVGAPDKGWPGLAPAGALIADPDDEADRAADALLHRQPWLRIGFVPAPRGSDTLAACGWHGPANHTNNTAQLCAVLCSWESRFGARAIGLGFDTLTLSIAAPPRTIEEALVISAEHLAFCPDNIYQGPGAIGPYAKQVLEARVWNFWWD